ncbi:MAG: MFS transporter [Burkholderiales bacterium]|nr:MFS transporter [Burkholderiales bacterium]
MIATDTALTRQKTNWASVIVILSAGIVAAAYLGKLPPALPLVTGELALSLQVAGLIISAFSMVGAIAAMLTGVMIDLIGARRSIVVGLILLAAGGIFGALAGNVYEFALSRLVEGVGFILVVVAAPSLIARTTTGPKQRFAYGLWGIHMGIGTSVIIVASWPILEAVGWRSLWMGSAFVALLVLAVAIEILPKDPPRPTGGPWTHGASRTLLRAGPWLLMTLFAAYTAMWFSLLTWLPSFLVENNRSSIGVAALLTAAVIAANVPGNLLGGYLLHQNAPRGTLMLVGAAAMTVCQWIIFNADFADMVRYFACVGFSAVGGLLPPSIFSSAPIHAASPNHVGIVNGLAIQGSHLGQVIAPVLITYFVHLGGWQGAKPVMIVFGLAAILTSLAIIYGERGNAAAAPLP